MRRWQGFLLICLSLAAASHALAQPAPVADHHQHLFNPRIVALIGGGGSLKPVDADTVVKALDDAGIANAALLSVAYLYGSPARNVDDEYAKVRAENDWTAEQAALYPGRLRALCGVNPLKDYALAEIARCAAHPGLKHGLKMHFGNSDVQLELPGHVAQLKRVFAAANAHRMALVIHLRASISRKRDYGPAQARIFIEQLLPLVPDVPVQIAHMAGSGDWMYEDDVAEAVMAELAAAVASGDPRTRPLWFDVAALVGHDITPAKAALVVQRLRQVGMQRVLYGTDGLAGSNLRPREAWAAFKKLPLTDREIAQVAGNVAPYLK